MGGTASTQRTSTAILQSLEGLDTNEINKIAKKLGVSETNVRRSMKRNGEPIAYGNIVKIVREGQGQKLARKASNAKEAAKLKAQQARNSTLQATATPRAALVAAKNTTGNMVRALSAAATGKAQQTTPGLKGYFGTKQQLYKTNTWNTRKARHDAKTGRVPLNTTGKLYGGTKKKPTKKQPKKKSTKKQPKKKLTKKHTKK